MSKEVLQGIIDNFNLSDFETFFREKNNVLSFPNSPRDEFNIDPNFIDAFEIAEGDIPLTRDTKTPDIRFIVCAFKSVNDLSERSSKKAQYTVGKNILKNFGYYAGIFIFYDTKGDFRFSLIYADYSNNKVNYSSFKRFTYFVSKEQTNKTFLMQIGNGDFTTLEGIKQAFSVDKVTKDFYKEIADWYFWAVKNVKIPPDAEREQGSKNVAIIRLITRIIFAWFIKVYGLIPPQLFQYADVLDLLQDVSDNESTYYKAILMNLFFATLNTKMSDRASVYKFDALFKDKEKAMSYFKEVPFLNGGLFECLDREEVVNGVPQQVFIDGFTEQDVGLSIPNYLFFCDNAKVDLNEEYGTKNKEYNVRGLINILSSYNFTVDENTPVDQEIALDPELLGKVFENLLASYNPETATSARKATGSYYTPREIVDYMVRISLLEYFKEQLPFIPEEKLKLLLSDSDDIPDFTNEEKKKITESINHLKVLDPACGSGAFPMGILQRLVSVLQKIDPNNYYWCNQQVDDLMEMSQFIGKNVQDEKEAEEEKKEIKELFDERILYPDYARKLYLIQNCIYGVDIQPIAIQISKLRFFISIAIDQKIDRKKENYGIRPLPNLETKFVAANTLIKLDDAQHLATDTIINLEEQLRDNRRRYFYAKTHTEKEKRKKKDREIREQLAKELRKLGMEKGATDRIAEFDIFDQNKSASWFDPEWMFGVEDGFDIVIGNPPYGARILEKEKEYFLREYKSAKTVPGKQKGSLDTFSLFIERGFEVLKKFGFLIYIVPISVTSSESMGALYNLLEENCEEIRISSYAVRPQPIFENSVVDVSIFSFVKTLTPNERVMCTKLYRKSEKTPINYILSNLQFINCKKYKLLGLYPKISLQIEADILEKLFSIKTKVGDLIKEHGTPIYYRSSGGRYFKVITNFPTNSPTEKVLYFAPELADSMGAILSSNLFFWYYQIYSDNHSLKLHEIESFPVPLDRLIDENIRKLVSLYSNYLNDIKRNVRVRISDKYANIDSFNEYKICKSKKYIDLIDDFICPLYGLSKEEIEFIKNYEIDFRLSGNKQDDSL